MCSPFLSVFYRFILLPLKSPEQLTTVFIIQKNKTDINKQDCRLTESFPPMNPVNGSLSIFLSFFFP